MGKLFQNLTRKIGTIATLNTIPYCTSCLIQKNRQMKLKLQHIHQVNKNLEWSCHKLLSKGRDLETI